MNLGQLKAAIKEIDEMNDDTEVYIRGRNTGYPFSRVLSVYHKILKREEAKGLDGPLAVIVIDEE